MEIKIIYVLVKLLFLIKLAAGYSFLAFFPFPVPSHHSAFQPLVRGLLERGHHVTYFSPYRLRETPKTTDNYTEIILSNYMEDAKKIMIGKLGTATSFNPRDHMYRSQLMMIVLSRLFGLEIGRLTLRDVKFKQLLASDAKFDAILYCGSFMQDMYAGLSHRFNTHLIEVLPAANLHYTYWMYGNPFDTSYIVDFSVALSDRMNFMERIENTLNSVALRAVWYWYYFPKYEQLMNEELRYPGWEDRPSLQALLSNTSLVLMNTHLALNYPYPLSPNFKEVGGINVNKPKPLPTELQNFMDTARDGVIYFSLGSHISPSELLAGGIKEYFIKAFSKVKQKILWKWDQEFPSLPSNVRISRWFPQQDILNHKNCKLFITHGGFLSLAESVYHGVPMIGIPVLGDQLKNVKHMEVYEYGIHLDLYNLTEDTLSWAIHQIIYNPKYQENMKKRSLLLRDKPETALETAVYWTEYVVRHKGAHHLKPAISTMPWYQQAMIDVYAAILLIILIPIYIMYKVIHFLVIYIFCKSNRKCNVDKIKKNK